MTAKAINQFYIQNFLTNITALYDNNPNLPLDYKTSISILKTLNHFSAYLTEEEIEVFKMKIKIYMARPKYEE